MRSLPKKTRKGIEAETECQGNLEMSGFMVPPRAELNTCAAEQDIFSTDALPTAYVPCFSVF